MNELCPVEIKFADIEYLKRLLRDSAADTVVIADKMTCGIWGIAGVLNDRGGSIVWIDSIPSNPTQADVLNALRAVGDREPSQIITIGGGSSIDLAKALSAFRYMFDGAAPTVESITAAMKDKSYTADHRMIDIIAVPSTSGTGSEVTKWATVWDVNKVSKFSIESPALYARQALIIPELTASMPAKLTLSTALDALCHASEAFWAKHTNPVVKEFSCRAIDIIMTNLKPALLDPANIEYRKKLAMGSVLAGISFGQTHTTACHSISYPITMNYGVMHGLACVLTLDAVSKINRPATEDADMLFDIYAKHGGLAAWLNDVCEGIVTLRLSAFGIPEEAIELIARNTFTKGRMDNNPVDITEEQVVGILRTVY